MKKALGIYIEHRYRKSDWLYLVSVWQKPFTGPDGHPMSNFCHLCQTPHFTKTVHLHLVQGRAIVSQGVLSELRMAGLPDLDIVGTTNSPPSLTVGDAPRVSQDQTSRRIRIWKDYKPKGVMADAAT